MSSARNRMAPKRDPDNVRVVPPIVADADADAAPSRCAPGPSRLSCTIRKKDWDGRKKRKRVKTRRRRSPCFRGKRRKKKCFRTISTTTLVIHARLVILCNTGRVGSGLVALKLLEISMRPQHSNKYFENYYIPRFTDVFAFIVFLIGFLRDRYFL